ncbi:MAG TPA: glycine zipper 2TM domain-containing protein [Gammaproteobacteria bacterium]|nr:glycine zipper 2TM domain-containing protein [Gammaproteobacteria bacterium]
MLAKKTLLATALLGFLAVSTAMADGRYNSRGRGNAYGHYRSAPAVVTARVVDVEPMVRYVTVDRPRQECWDEVVRQPVRPYGVAGTTAAGSVVGAAIGRQFGSGNDRDALTVLGAVAGGVVARNHALRNGAGATRDVAVERCEVVSDRVREQVVDGYLVTYRLDGRNYTMRTDRHPGDWVQLAVDPRPVNYRVRY